MIQNLKTRFNLSIMILLLSTNMPIITKNIYSSEHIDKKLCIQTDQIDERPFVTKEEALNICKKTIDECPLYIYMKSIGARIKWDNFEKAVKGAMGAWRHKPAIQINESEVYSKIREWFFSEDFFDWQELSSPIMDIIVPEYDEKKNNDQSNEVYKQTSEEDFSFEGFLEKLYELDEKKRIDEDRKKTLKELIQIPVQKNQNDHQQDQLFFETLAQKKFIFGLVCSQFFTVEHNKNDMLQDDQEYTGYNISLKGYNFSDLLKCFGAIGPKSKNYQHGLSILTESIWFDFLKTSKIVLFTGEDALFEYEPILKAYAKNANIMSVFTKDWSTHGAQFYSPLENYHHDFQHIRDTMIINKGKKGSAQINLDTISEFSKYIIEIEEQQIDKKLKGLYYFIYSTVIRDFQNNQAYDHFYIDKNMEHSSTVINIEKIKKFITDTQTRFLKSIKKELFDTVRYQSSASINYGEIQDLAKNVMKYYPSLAEKIMPTTQPENLFFFKEEELKNGRSELKFYNPFLTFKLFDHLFNYILEKTEANFKKKQIINFYNPKIKKIQIVYTQPGFKMRKR